MAGRKHEERRENNMLHELLMGLYSDYYAQVRSNILSHDPLPPLDGAYQLDIQDERVLLAKPVALEHQPPDVMAFSLGQVFLLNNEQLLRLLPNVQFEAPA